jgi:hypothetical protein
MPSGQAAGLHGHRLKAFLSMGREQRAQVFGCTLFPRDGGGDILRAGLFDQGFNAGAWPRAQLVKKIHWQPP